MEVFGNLCKSCVFRRLSHTGWDLKGGGFRINLTVGLSESLLAGIANRIQLVRSKEVTTQDSPLKVNTSAIAEC